MAKNKNGKNNDVTLKLKNLVKQRNIDIVTTKKGSVKKCSRKNHGSDSDGYCFYDNN